MPDYSSNGSIIAYEGAAVRAAKNPGYPKWLKEE